MTRFILLSVFIDCYVLLWWLVPTLMAATPPLDTLEGLLWGDAWQLGYYKHPPLQAWILAGLANTLGYYKIVLYLPPALCVGLALLGIWKAAVRLVPESTALLAALLPTTLHFYNFSATEFNPNILQMPLWAWMGWAFICLIQEGRAKYFYILGLLSAAAFYTKYSSLLLMISISFYVLCCRRDLLKCRAFWLAKLMFFVLVAPQLYWLYQHHFMPGDYVMMRAGMEGGYEFSTAASRALSFVASQLGMAAALGMILLVLCWRRPRFMAGAPLAFVTWGPWLLMLAFVLATGGKVRDMWTAPMWNFVPLFFLMLFPVRLKTPRVLYVILAINLCYLGAYMAAMRLGPETTGKIRREHFAGEDFAAAVQEKMDTYGIADPILISDVWHSGVLHFYLPNHPTSVIDAKPSYSPWVSQQEIDARGALLVWKNEVPKEILDAFTISIALGKIDAGWTLGKGYEPYPVELYYIPPKSMQDGS